MKKGIYWNAATSFLFLVWSNQAAVAAECSLWFKVNGAGNFWADFKVQNAPVSGLTTKDIQEVFLPIPQTKMVSKEAEISKNSAVFKAAGTIDNPQANALPAILTWFKSALPKNHGVQCLTKKLTLRSSWRYSDVPAGALHQYPEHSLVQFKVGRLSAERDSKTELDFYGVELELVLDRASTSESPKFGEWIDSSLAQTDLKVVGEVWADRSMEQKFPEKVRAEMAFGGGSYSPAERAQFLGFVRAAIVQESELSRTFFWKRSYFSTQFLFGGTKPAGGGLATEMYDFSLSTGLHWRPDFNANTVDTPGIRNFISISISPGLHRVFATSEVPFRIHQAFTAPSIDAGIFWGAYNRKINLTLGLEYYARKYFTSYPFGLNHEFAMSFAF